jgi:hypothetical protein
MRVSRFPLGEAGSDISIAPLALRRAHRLALAGDRRRGQENRLLRFRSAAAHILAQVARWQGRHRCTRLHAAGDGRRKLSPRAWARSGPVVPTIRRLSRSMPRSSSRRRRVGAARAQGGAQGRPGGLRRHPHERYPQLSLRHFVGRARAVVGRESDAQGRHRFPAPGAPQIGIKVNDEAVSAASSQRGARGLARRTV